MFDEFWMLYPRKVAKASARKAWQKLTEQQQLLAAKAISNHCQYWKAKETALDYIPHASTWLNQGRWEDELDLQPKEVKKPQLPWYSNEELTLAKGREIGLNPNAGETMSQYRSRIQQKLLGV
mgnify:CR=1 FL=1